MIHLAQRMACVHSDIRGPLYREALRMQQQGIPVMKLNTGNPAAFGFPLSESIRAALEEEAFNYSDEIPGEDLGTGEEYVPVELPTEE